MDPQPIHKNGSPLGLLAKFLPQPGKKPSSYVHPTGYPTSPVKSARLSGKEPVPGKLEGGERGQPCPERPSSHPRSRLRFIRRRLPRSPRGGKLPLAARTWRGDPASRIRLSRPTQTRGRAPAAPSRRPRQMRGGRKRRRTAACAASPSPASPARPRGLRFSPGLTGKRKSVPGGSAGSPSGSDARSPHPSPAPPRAV